MIRLRRVRHINEHPSEEYPASNFWYVNTLSWFLNNVQVVDGVPLPSYEVSPYHLRTESTEGIIFENLWQGSKIYPKVNSQRQVVNGQVIWEHPSEVHIDRSDTITEAYWNWRNKLFASGHAVRYPNGYKGRRDCRCSVLLDERTGTIECLDYINARKRIYVQNYATLVQKTEAYRVLQILIGTGHNLCFTDIDCPESIIVNQDSYDRHLNDDKHPFGHTWILAGLLLGLKVTGN